MQGDTKKSRLFDNQLLSIIELSQFLSVSVNTIRDWVHKRKVPFVKVGRLVRFKPSDIELWLKQGEINGHN